MLNILQQRMTAVLLALGWALVPNAFSQRPPSAAESSIRVVSTQGMVQVQRAGANISTPAQTNQSLFANDRIRTGQRSRALLRWSEDSTLRLADRTEVRILPPAKPGALNDVDAAQGFFYFFHRGEPGDLRVINRLVTAAIQGTEFSYEVDANDGTTRIVMFDGAVELSNAFGTERITSGQSAIVQPGQPPRRTAVLMGGGREQWLGQWRDLSQWCLYYPAVLDVDEAGLAAEEQQALAESIAAYRQGDLLQALEKYPAGRQPAAAAETVYLAALILSVGDVKQAEDQLRRLDEASLPGRTETHLALADALRKLIASVKFQPWPSNAAPRLATEWMAESYQRQSQGRIDGAREAALAATKQAPRFGFAWARVAELEFSRGRTDAALKALDLSLNLSPRNAQALALRGFLLAAKNQIAPATDWFDQAITIDPALGNAWLGRGLCRIRSGDEAGGREDLLVAASLEPQRSLLRSYLGKALANGRDPKRARHELELARHLDPADPTPWLYSALLNSDDNRINEGIRDLERSKELNDNRQIFRSRLLLDEDRAVRSASLARIYAEAGLSEAGLREASRGISANYADYSAHLFLAQSYESLRSANFSSLRFEAANYSEYLLASLLGPADGRLLSQNISQQEYSRLFERERLGLSSRTEYLSRGAWTQEGAQFGDFGRTSYALAGSYKTDPGDTPHGALEARQFTVRLKHLVTPDDGFYFEATVFRQTQEDRTQHYDPASASTNYHVTLKQEPLILAGWDHRWEEGHHTLALAGYFNASLDRFNGHGAATLLSDTGSGIDGVVATDLTERFRNSTELASFELQHLARFNRIQVLAGLRVQAAGIEIRNRQTIYNGNAVNLESYFGNSGTVIANQSVSGQSLRVSPYVYEYWQLTDTFQWIAGLSLDYQRRPRNLLFAPVDLTDETDFAVSPRTALIWEASGRTTVRAGYSQSLGGADFDQSVRLEPTQLGGFVQTFRNLIPNSLAGDVGGAAFETIDLAVEHRLPTDTYLAVSAQLLRSRSEHDLGAFRRDSNSGQGPAVQIEERLRYQERAAEGSIDQLIGEWFSVGVRYRISEARLNRSYPGFDPAICYAGCGRTRGWLQTAAVRGMFHSAAGFFAGVEAVWREQDLRDLAGDLPGDHFWQVDVQAGWRSPRRRVEVVVGVLNLGDRGYRLHPINLHPELPRERTLFTRLTFNF